MLVNGANFQASILAVSVTNPDLIEAGDLRDAQKVLNRESLLAATRVAVGGLYTVQVVERQSLEGSEPLGTMLIREDGDIQAEGNSVSFPTPPTLDVNCFWPTRYTPAGAPADERQSMVDLGDQICISAGGCTEGTPHCVTGEDRPLG